MSFSLSLLVSFSPRSLSHTDGIHHSSHRTITQGDIRTAHVGAPNATDRPRHSRQISLFRLLFLSLSHSALSVSRALSSLSLSRALFLCHSSLSFTQSLPLSNSICHPFSHCKRLGVIAKNKFEISRR